MIDFNFTDLKNKNKDEVIKTDHHFIIDEPIVEEIKEIKSEEKEPKVEMTKSELKSDEIAIDNSIADTPVAAGIATVATVAILSTIEEEKDQQLEVIEAPAIEPTPIVASVIEEPLRKVSEARKSLEPSKSPVETEVKLGSIAIAEESKSAEPEKLAENPKAPEPEINRASEIIAEVPKQKEEVNIAEKESENINSYEVEEITAPPPLPTDNGHLIVARESLKPSLLPVMPMNGAPTADFDAPKPPSSSSPLAAYGITAAELEQMRKELDEQKLALEREIDNKKALESQIQAMISKSNAQEEALKYKNESLEQIHSDYLKTNNDLTSARNEKEKLESDLAKAEKELAKISESNAKDYLEKSDEVTTLKDKVAEFAAIIGQKNKEIDSLQRQLDEVKRTNVKTTLESVQQYEMIEEELLKIAEEEILRMQDTIEEQREYNAKLQMEVEAEYTYWKKRLEAKAEGEQHNTTE